MEPKNCTMSGFSNRVWSVGEDSPPHWGIFKILVGLTKSFLLVGHMFLQSIAQLISCSTGMQTLHEQLILFFGNSTMILWEKCQPDNLWYSSDTGGLRTEAIAVTSTFPAICFWRDIQHSVWIRYFFKFILTIHNEAHMNLCMNAEYFRCWSLQSAPLI